jgi:hypothetical protein
MTFLRKIIPLYLLVEHDLFGKPVPTFPDHAKQTLAADSAFSLAHGAHRANPMRKLNTGVSRA